MRPRSPEPADRRPSRATMVLVWGVLPLVAIGGLVARQGWRAREEELELLARIEAVERDVALARAVDESALLRESAAATAFRERIPCREADPVGPFVAELKRRLEPLGIIVRDDVASVSESPWPSRPDEVRVPLQGVDVAAARDALAGWTRLVEIPPAGDVAVAWRWDCGRSPLPPWDSLSVKPGPWPFGGRVGRHHARLGAAWAERERLRPLLLLRATVHEERQRAAVTDELAARIAAR